MKIDVWTHVLSPSYLRQLEAAGPELPAGQFLLAQRALHDIDFRLRQMDAYGDYRQILAPIPAPHVHVGRDASAVTDHIRRNNDEMAEMVGRHPDSFAGFSAATPLADPDAATEEAVRSVRELGALGVQLEEDPINLPLHEDRYEPLFAAMEQLSAGVWLHPYRTPGTPGSPLETAPFLLWQVYGWTFDTTITIARLVFAGIYDRHPDLKLIAHHGGGIIPHFSGRVERLPWFTLMAPDLEEALGRLQKRPIEYFKMLFVDTAMFGSPHGVQCVINFFGPDRVLFGTDAPFDSESGSYFIPITISDVDEAVRDHGTRAAIFAGNAMRILGVGSVRPPA